jgi:hypothetical protein
MRIVLVHFLALVLLAGGCAHNKAQKSQSPQGDFSAVPGVGAPSNETTPNGQKLIVTPDNALTGKVVSVNQTARFVVLSFPVGRLPAAEQQFSVYRRGLKVADIKITSQQLNEYIVADIVDGDAEAGDEVRNR